MIRFFCFIALSFCSVYAWAVPATVGNFNEFKTAVTQKATPIHLNHSLFQMNANLLIDYDCVIDITYPGDVVVDGLNTYAITFQDCTAVIGNASGNHTLSFNRGSVHGVTVQSTHLPTRLIFHYCRFNFAAGNGLNIWPSITPEASTVEVTCYSCQANTNNYDGYSLKNVVEGHNQQWQILNLINCSATNNDPTGISNGAGDGVTAHDVKQVINLIGGTYYENGKMGAVPTLGSSMYAKGVTFYGNNKVTQIGNVHIALGCTVLLEDCTFMDLGGTENYLCHVFVDNHPDNFVVIRNCRFKSSQPDQGGVYVEIVGGVCALEGNLFRDNFQNLRETVRTRAGVKLYATNNIFYNVKRGLELDGDFQLVNNNIFGKITDYAIASAGDGYTGNSDSGSNLFYEVQSDHFFYNSSSKSYASQAFLTDKINLDPQFKDYANNNFSLASTSPCVNTGRGPLDAGLNNIGLDQSQYINALKPVQLFADDFENASETVSTFPDSGFDADPVASVGQWQPIQEAQPADIQVTSDLRAAFPAAAHYLAIHQPTSSVTAQLEPLNFPYPLVALRFDLFFQPGATNPIQFSLYDTSNSQPKRLLKNIILPDGKIMLSNDSETTDTGLTLQPNRWNQLVYLFQRGSQTARLAVALPLLNPYYHYNDIKTDIPLETPFAQLNEIVYQILSTDGVCFLDNIDVAAWPQCTTTNQVDLNGDCQVDLADFSVMSNSLDQ